MSDKSTDVNSKILIDFKEYERLKNIEELYLKSQAKLEKNLRFSNSRGKNVLFYKNVTNAEKIGNM
jgi:PHD/YefM family antitoxin component YafN of YafNO toxin-antitoxin module